MRKSQRIPSGVLGHTVDFVRRVRWQYLVMFFILLVAPFVSLRKQEPSFEAPAITLGIGSVAHAVEGGACVASIVLPPGMESISLAMQTWAKMWGVYTCAFETVRSGVEKFTSWWNDNAEFINKRLKDIETTKNSLQKLETISVRGEEQGRQVKQILDTLIIKNKDWTKIRLNKVDPDKLLFLQDMDALNANLDSIAKRISKESGMKVEVWKNSPQGTAFLNAVKARNDLSVETAKSKAIEKEFSSHEKAANSVPCCEIHSPEAMELYGKAALPTTHKLQLAQYQLAILQTEILIKIYEGLVLQKPIDRNPMGEDAASYLKTRLHEFEGRSSSGKR